MTNQQGAPEALPSTWAQDLSTAISLLGMARVGLIPSDAASNARWRLDELSRALAALVEAQQPAPSAAVAAEAPGRTDAEIVAQTVELTKYLLSWKWGLEPEGDISRIWESKNTKAQVCWNAACHIQDLLTQTDVWNAVAELDGQPSPAPQADSAPASVAGPMQFGGCPECGSRTCVARECSRTVSHTAQALPGVQWQCGPQANGFTAPQADSQPAPVRNYPPLPHELTRTDRGHLIQRFRVEALMRAYVDADRAARAPADSVTAPAGCNNIPGMAEKALAKLKSHIDHVAHKDGHWETRHLKDALFDLEWIVRRKLTPTPPAQAADSLLEDAARLDWLQANSCDLRCIGVSTGGDDYDINWVVIEHYQAKPHEREIGRSYQDDPRGAIDAARKQGGAT